MAQSQTLESDLIQSRLSLVLSLPPHRAVQRLFGAVRRRVSKRAKRARDLAGPTYAADTPSGDLQIVCDAVAPNHLAPNRGWIERAANLFSDQRFDILGSGWMRVIHGCVCAGMDGTRYPAQPAIVADPDGAWLRGRINTANLTDSRRIWKLVDPGYIPIDWQIDFRSGYRWGESTWSGDIVFGILDDVDVKVPWELSRMQHLAPLAWAHILTGAPSSPFARTFRNQILDFMATNPPRFGVNWVCAMDVAIRAANWVVAFSLFRAAGVRFDEAFLSEFKRSLIDHGRHIVSHLEIYPEGRGNHYLADVCGLLFVAAALPACAERERWLTFSVREVLSELRFQFNEDGTNFEGSTAYHRLSTEMVAYATALAVGLQRSELHSGAAPGEQLAKAAGFLMHVTKADGRMAQIGDNDSGRFFKPHPVYSEHVNGPIETHLDCRGTIGLVEALLDPHGQNDATVADRLDRDLAQALTRGRPLFAGTAPVEQSAEVARGARSALIFDPAHARTVEIVAPGPNLCRNIALRGYPDFGLWVFRSERMFLAIRCGRAHGRGLSGSHAHNDQLSIELSIDGEDWLADPGSYLYCPPSARRDAWRSVRAHTAPQWPDLEPGRLDLGIFQLADKAQARCLYFGPDGFAGEHYGFGQRVRRLILFGDNTIKVCDIGLPRYAKPALIKCEGREAVRAAFPSTVPFSDGYGQKRAASA